MRLNRRNPRYIDDADYTTNSPSYYHDLGRKNKLLQKLAEKIWDYDERLDERLEDLENVLKDYLSQWDERIENLDDEVSHIFVTWLNDGTLEQIINHDVLGNKADKSFVDSEIERLEQKDENLTAQLAQTMPVVNVRNYADGDGTDETLKLQQALDEAEGKILFWNKQTGSGYRTKPLYVRQNTTILFEPNTLVKATTGYASHDCVLNIQNVDNVVIEGNNSTIQMIKSEYTTGEWRHCLNIWGAENVRVSGMSFNDSGGDGILITGSQYSTPYRKAKNVNIFNCYMDNNRRQGISIAGYVDEVVIDACVITNTNGTLPQAGIDIEPNGPEWDNRNITVQNCLLKDNSGAGLLVYNNSYNIKLLNNVLENNGINILRNKSDDAHPSVEIKGNKTPSIFINSVNNTLIEGNETGTIFIQSTLGLLSFNRIINNKVMNSASKGIRIESNSNIVIAGNYIENSTTEAIELTQCESAVVENNTLIGCSSVTAMRVTTSPNTIVRGNKVRKKEKETNYCIIFSGAGNEDTLVENNDFFDGAVTRDIQYNTPHIIIGTNTFLDGRKSVFRVTDFLPQARKGWMGRFIILKKPDLAQELYTCVENPEGDTYTFKKIQFME